MQLPWGQIVRDAFFTKVDGTDGQWTCKCGTVRKQKGTGYSNLTSHVRHKHPADLDRLSAESNQTTSTTSSGPTSLFFNRKTVQMFGWIDLVIGGLLPFSVVDNDVYRRHVRHEPISRRTLCSYMVKLTENVEKKIADQLPSQFAIVFDGWSTGDTHYVACFASYPAANTDGFSMALLGFSPFEDELSQNADLHYKYLEFLLELFGKSNSNIVALIGDNCSCNRKLADLVGCALLGCASHRFNVSSKANIVHCPDFESGVVKIQDNKCSELTADETAAIACLRKMDDSNSTAPLAEGLSLADRVLKRRRVETVGGAFIDTRFLVLTSNVCERLFSKAGYALSCRRKGMSPASFEQQIFLHANSELWGIADVASLID